jgi:hypothetical protein
MKFIHDFINEIIYGKQNNMLAYSSLLFIKNTFHGWQNFRIRKNNLGVSKKPEKPIKLRK